MTKQDLQGLECKHALLKLQIEVIGLQVLDIAMPTANACAQASLAHAHRQQCRRTPDASGRRGRSGTR